MSLVMKSTAGDDMSAKYNAAISNFPSELQTAGAVLYAIVRTVSDHSSSTHLNDPQALQCHHFLDGSKMEKLQVLGPDATFLSLVEQARQDVRPSGDAVVLECNDSIGMQTADASDFVNQSAGTRSEHNSI